jgi:hypothetical protein
MDQRDPRGELNGIGPDELVAIARQLPQGVTRP